MKVYVVMAFSAEPDGHSDWIHGIYHKKEDAKAALGDSKYQVYCEDMENNDYGYMLSNHIREVEVQ